MNPLFPPSLLAATEVKDPGLARYLTPEFLMAASQALLVLAVGILLVRAAGNGVTKRCHGRVSAQQGLILRKAIVWGGNALIVIVALQQIGFKIGGILGAAGVFGVAIGFAAQTSMSNLISGLFLIFEQPFSIGDVITVGGVTGEVSSIDLLSIKIRKPDNAFVRIPNETILKDAVTNVTRFPIRRVDINVAVSYSDKLEDAKAVLSRLARAHPLVLMDPEPVYVYKGFGTASMDILLGVWVQKDDYGTVSNDLIVQIKDAFDEAGIEIPFTRAATFPAEALKPLAVRLVDSPKP